MKPFLQSGGRPSLARVPLRTVLQALGLVGGLQLCLDAGDAASYTSGQSWLDRSGNGYDFFRGADNSATATDPTFNGSAGGLSSGEYFSFDGGDYCTYDSANETWMESLHKDNATFTIMSWVWPDLDGTGASICGTKGAGTTLGAQWRWSNGATQQLLIGNGSADTSITGSNYADSVWQFSAVSIDEAVGSNGAIFILNNTTTLKSSTFTSPSASAASQVMKIGQRGDGNDALRANSRLAMFAAWNVALSESKMRSIYNATRGRFGV